MELEFHEMASGLRFPEGPIALSDGSVLLLEIERQTLSRVLVNGTIQVVATLEGGPNGAAVGPDGAIYICNNGGFNWIERNSRLLPGTQPEHFGGGSIQRVEMSSGKVDTIYRDCSGNILRGPNDIVFAKDGSFWFTDLGKMRDRDKDYGGLYFANIDGTHIEEKIFPIPGGGNGVGLSPDGKSIYVAETASGRLFGWELQQDGSLPDGLTAGFRNIVYTPDDYINFDSLAVEENGNICVATIGPGQITVISPNGEKSERISVGNDPLITNICFGGPDMRTAYITLSSTGRLITCQWPRPGLNLNFQI